MKSKKLLISLAVVAVVIVIVVIMIAVFAVDDVMVRYHDFDGREITAGYEGDYVVPDEILKLIKGKSTVFLSKTKLIEQLNQEHSDWHAFAVVKNFPNTVEVHFVKRTIIAKMSIGGQDVYIDSFGYLVNSTSESCVDISSAFPIGIEAWSTQPGSPLTFKDSKNDIRLKCVLEAILATWRCKVEVNDIPQILGFVNVFSFDDDGNLLITPKEGKGGTIKVIAPETNLSNRLIDAYSAYYTDAENLQDGDVITVHKNGSITSPGKSKK